MQRAAIKRTWKLIGLELKSVYALLLVLIIGVLQFFGLLMLILRPEPRPYALTLIYLFMLHLYDLSWLLKDRSEWEYRLKALPVTENELLISRLVFRVLLFGAIYVVSIPILAVVASSTFTTALAKFIVPGMVVAIYTAAHILFFIDIATSFAKNTILKWALVVIAAVPLAAWYFLLFLFSDLRNFLSAWFMELPISTELYLAYAAVFVVAGIMIWLDARLFASPSFATGVQELRGDQA